MRTDFKWMAGFFAVGALLLLLTVRGVDGNPTAADIKGKLDQIGQPLELAPERSRFAHAATLAESGTYSLDAGWSSAVSPDVINVNGNAYGYFAPGLSYLAMPFYMLGKALGLSQVAVFLFISLATLMTGLLLFRIAREILGLSAWSSLFVSLTFLFATISWSYANTLYDHNLTAFLMLLAFYSVWRFRSSPRAWAWSLAAWTAYGLAIFIDYFNVFLLLPIMLYFTFVSFEMSRTKETLKLRFKTAFFAGLAIFAGIMALHAYHNAKYFGGWNKTALSYAPASFSEENLPFSFYTLTAAGDRGLLLYSPILVLGVLGIFKLRRKIELEHVVLICLVVFTLLIYSSSPDPWGGWAFGPRYLIPMMAVLSLFVGNWVERASYRVATRLMALAFFMYSSAVALLGALTTNGVPPKIESIYLGIKYNFMRNVDLLLDGQSSSFIYNNYLSRMLSLPGYYLAIYLFLLAAVALILFAIPKPDDRALD